MYVYLYVLCVTYVYIYIHIYKSIAQRCNPAEKTVNFQISSSGFCMSPNINVHLLRIKLNSAHSHFSYVV